MTWIAAAVVTSAVVGYAGASKQASASKSAAAGQVDATKYAADVQKEMFDIINKQQDPYRKAGYSALTRIQDLLPSLTAPVSAQEIQNLPGFKFAIDQGTGAARQMFNVGGGGSNVDRAAQKFAIDYTLGTAMPQVIAQRQNIYNTLAGVANVGQTAQTQTNQAAMTTGTNIGQAAIGGATAYGAGQIGAANAYASGLSNVGNSALMYALLKG